jgi:phosphoglycerate dehydrogenase-like enzyme
MPKYRIGVTASFFDAHGQHIDGGMDLSPLTREPDIELIRLAPMPVLTPDVTRDLDAIFIREVELYNDSSVHPNHRLAHLSRLGVGHDNIDKDACNRHGVACTTTPDASRRPMAVATISLLMALAMRIKEKETAGRMGAPGFAIGPRYTGVGFVGRTLGIVGLGNIGREVARLMKVFEVKLIAHDPYVPQDVADGLGVELVGLHDLFRRSDFISLNCALTDETHHMINASCFDVMKPSAYFVNVARGPVVNQPDFIAAFNAGKMAGAALDVFDPEPPQPGDPILALDKDRAILTPHAIGFTDQIVDGMMECVFRSIFDVKAGRVPYGIVNKPIAENPDFLAKLKRYAAGEYYERGK